MTASAKPDIIETDTANPACQGDALSSHPRVYLALGKQGFADCPYCGKRYALKPGLTVNTH